MHLPSGLGRELLPRPFFCSPDEGSCGIDTLAHLLTQQLRRTSGRFDWRWTAEELDEPPQVLRGRSEQGPAPGAAQAAQSKSMESSITSQQGIEEVADDANLKQVYGGPLSLGPQQAWDLRWLLA